MFSGLKCACFHTGRFSPAATSMPKEYSGMMSKSLIIIFCSSVYWRLHEGAPPHGKSIFGSEKIQWGEYNYHLLHVITVAVLDSYNTAMWRTCLRSEAMLGLWSVAILHLRFCELCCSMCIKKWRKHDRNKVNVLFIYFSQGSALKRFCKWNLGRRAWWKVLSPFSFYF